MNGQQMVASGFGDVKFLGGGFFLANPPGGGPYKIYSTATGKPASDQLFAGIQQANYLGNGTIRIVGAFGNSQYLQVTTQPATQNRNGQTQASPQSVGNVAVASIPPPLPASTAINAQGQCLIQPGLSASLNHGVATPAIWGPCFAGQPQTAKQQQGAPNVAQAAAISKPQSQQPVAQSQNIQSQSSSIQAGNALVSSSAANVSSQGQCVIQPGLSAPLNHGVATSAISGPCARNAPQATSQTQDATAKALPAGNAQALAKAPAVAATESPSAQPQQTLLKAKLASQSLVADQQRLQAQAARYQQQIQQGVQQVTSVQQPNINVGPQSKQQPSSQAGRAATVVPAPAQSKSAGSPTSTAKQAPRSTATVATATAAPKATPTTQTAPAPVPAGRRK